jgi:hypothetical protein
MFKKYITFSIPRPSKIYKIGNFWFENKPSGNPASSERLERSPGLIYD